MHRLLENYLSEVAAHLSALPPKRRAEEMREMRAHLANAVLVNQEMGQSQDEAAQSAIVQFGTPPDLGENIVWAWQRGETRSRRGLWGAAACALAVQFLVPLPMIPLLAAYFNPISPAHLSTAQSVFLAANLTLTLGVPLLAGAASGFLFPKRAVAGTGIGAIAYFCLALAIGGYLLTHHAPVTSPVSASSVFLSTTSQSVTSGLVSLLSAWAVSRWRKARTGRARLARG